MSKIKPKTRIFQRKDDSITTKIRLMFLNPHVVLTSSQVLEKLQPTDTSIQTVSTNLQRLKSEKYLTVHPTLVTAKGGNYYSLHPEKYHETGEVSAFNS